MKKHLKAREEAARLRQEKALLEHHITELKQASVGDQACMKT